MPDEHHGRKQLIDWDKASEEPMAVEGSVLTVSGVAPRPVEIFLDPSPIGIVEDDYNGIEVHAVFESAGPEVETSWRKVLPDVQQYAGRVGFVLVGASKREYFPPKEGN
jgi:hypothetical protein